LTITSNTTTSGVRDFGYLIERMMTDEVELVYLTSLNLEQVGTFFREARQAGFTGTFFGPDSLDNPRLLDFSGTSLVLDGGTYYTALAAPATAYPGAADFVAAYVDLYGTYPPLYSAEAYDAAALCINGILQAREAKGGELPTRAEVASAIRALDGYAGITGAYTFDRNGDPNPARYYVFRLASASPANWTRNDLIAFFELPPPP
jgi:ABC-type branched-subunit amino acid transport system substrate-binding protein